MTPRSKRPRVPLTPTILLAILQLALGHTSTVLTAQKPVQKPKKVEPPSWPKLDRKAKARGEKYLKLLRSKKDEVRINAIDQLKMLGAGFADRAIRSLKDSENHNVNEQLVLVLDAVIKPAHAPLIALHQKHRATFGRRYVLKTLAKFGRKDSVNTFETARKDKDIEVAYYAALGLVKTTRSTAALDAIYDRCLEEWGDLAEELGRYLENSRSEDFLPWLGKKLKSKDSHECVTALRMMRFLAPTEAKSMVRRFLDSEHAILKKEAINTLRVIVDHKPALPLKKITVFMVIKLARDWKKRI